MKCSETIVLSALLAVVASPVIADPASCPKSPVIDRGGVVMTENAFFQSDDAHEVKLEPNNYYTIGKAQTLNCKADAGCVVFLQSQIAIVPDDSSRAVWTICMKVDGNPVSPTQGFEGSTDSRQVKTGTYQGDLRVTRGSHIIETVVGTPIRMTLSAWHETGQMFH